MDPYNLLQEQLANINNNLNNGFNKLQEDLRQLSRRVDLLESNGHGFHDQLEAIRRTSELVPKIYSNQVAVMETLLVGHQYQFRRLSNIVSRDNETPPFAESSNFHSQSNTNGLQNGLGGQVSNQVVGGADSLDSVANENQSSNQNQNNRINGNGNTNDTTTIGMINPSNSVNIPNNQNHQQDNSHNQSMNSRVNNAVNLGLITPNQNQIQSRRSNNSISTLRNYTSILPIGSDNGVLPVTPQSHPNNSQDDTNNILSEVTNTEDENARRLWDSVAFTRLNPNPKTVQEVLDEYHYGYQGQPPLKYLEEHRKEWRKGNKNLSKTFCRRYRIVTAVDAGIRLYSREYGTSESIARDRTIAELENLRIKDNGRKETMYWLFHHIPSHLKRR